MEKEEFNRLMNKRQYDELEEKLQKEYKKIRKNEIKCQLGICYSEQCDKINQALVIFKELLAIDYKTPYIFYFTAKHTKSKLESAKILKEGIRCFPEENLLKNELLLYLENDEKEKFYEKFYNKSIFDVSHIMNMISYYFEKGNYIEAYNILTLNIKNIKAEEYNEKVIEFLECILNYLNKNKIDLEKLYSLILAYDNFSISFILRVLEIDIISNDDILKGGKLLEELDYCEKYPEEFIEVINFSDYYSSQFTIKKILFLILDNLKSKFNTEEQKRKIKIVEDLHTIYYEDYEIKKSELRIIEKNLKKEFKDTKNNKILEHLLYVYEKLNDYKKYFNIYIEILNNNTYNEEYLIDYSKFTEEQINYVEEYICKNIEINKYNAKKYQNIIESFVQELNKREKYKMIVKISQSIDYKNLNYLNFGFELAYAFNEEKMYEEAKKMYEEYIEKYSNSSAVLNNLGLIYEKEENYEMALELYNKAEMISHDSIHINNINRCKELIKEYKKIETEELEGVNLFLKENIWIINKLKLFYSNADEKNNIICSYKKLPVFLKCDVEQAQELLNRFIKNNYVSRNLKHNYDTSSSVYRINLKILDKIKELDKNYEIISNFTNNLNDFTVQKLNEIDYIEIQKKLSKIKDKKIKNVFTRDYNELVFNYLSNQSKTVIIMSGTIIELILLYILEKNDINKYSLVNTKKSKKVEDMNITEMLEVCTLEKLINNAPQKFIDGVKNFRNFVHPGKELREKFLDIDKQTVDLVMSIVRWLILTIKFD